MNNKLPFLSKLLDSSPSVKSAARIGLIIFGSFLLIFIVWGTFFDLESAAIAEGIVTVNSENKTVQHLEGGIVDKIFVQEGSKVKQGDPLIQLDKTQLMAKIDLLRLKKYGLIAEEARLIAVQTEAKTPDFPGWLLKIAQKNPKVATLIRVQQHIFDAESKAIKDKALILQQRIEQLKNQISSYESQAKSFNEQLNLINEEIEAMMSLAKRNLIEKPRLLALKREAARLTGSRDEQRSQIAKAEQQIGEVKTELISLNDDNLRQAVTQLKENQNDLNTVTQELLAAEDVLKRTLITAPYSGTVVNLTVFSKDSVISPGVTLMNIVPSEDSLTIKARVSPLDIDVVHPGLLVRVQFTSLKQRSTPQLEGVLEQVSADSKKDERTGEHFYEAKIKLYPGELKKLGKVTLYPGMPVQVMIIVAQRSFFDYLITPIRDSFKRAFRET